MEPTKSVLCPICRPRKLIGFSLIAQHLGRDVPSRSVNIGNGPFTELSPVFDPRTAPPSYTLLDVPDAQMRFTSFTQAIMGRIAAYTVGDEYAPDVESLRIIRSGGYTFFEVVIADNAYLMVLFAEENTLQSHVSCIFETLGALYTVQIQLLEFGADFAEQALAALDALKHVEVAALPPHTDMHPAWGLFDTHER